MLFRSSGAVAAASKVLSDLWQQLCCAAPSKVLGIKRYVDVCFVSSNVIFWSCGLSSTPCLFWGAATAAVCHCVVKNWLFSAENQTVSDQKCSFCGVCTGRRGFFGGVFPRDYPRFCAQTRYKNDKKYCYRYHVGRCNRTARARFAAALSRAGMPALRSKKLLRR